MESLYLLIPLSVVLVLAILAVFGWALYAGQFEELDHEGERILTEGAEPVDRGQADLQAAGEESAPHRPSSE